MFHLLSFLLAGAAVGIFLLRRRHERPALVPYLVIAHVSIAGSWLGNHGGGAPAVGLLIAGAFLTLHLASQPYGEFGKQ